MTDTKEKAIKHHNYSIQEIQYIQQELMYSSKRKDYMCLFCEIFSKVVNNKDNLPLVNALERLVISQIKEMEKDEISDLSIGYIQNRFETLIDSIKNNG